MLPPRSTSKHVVAVPTATCRSVVAVTVHGWGPCWFRGESVPPERFDLDADYPPPSSVVSPVPASKSHGV